MHNFYTLPFYVYAIREITLYFLDGPKVMPVPEIGLVTVMAGESARLGCHVISGNPTPSLSWVHQVNIFCKE